MKKLLVIYFLLMSYSVYSQKVERIEGKNYKGYIFPENFNVLSGIQNQEGRFTPDIEIIEAFECELYKRINELTKHFPNQGKGCPKIKKANLRKYTRQYFGFTTESGEQVLFVNFIWSKSISEIKDKLPKGPWCVYMMVVRVIGAFNIILQEINLAI